MPRIKEALVSCLEEGNDEEAADFWIIIARTGARAIEHPADLSGVSFEHALRTAKTIFRRVMKEAAIGSLSCPYNRKNLLDLVRLLLDRFGGDEENARAAYNALKEFAGLSREARSMIKSAKAILRPRFKK